MKKKRRKKEKKKEKEGKDIIVSINLELTKFIWNTFIKMRCVIIWLREERHN
jgi:hypothetical protein